jgi:hypothetical protein
MHEPTRGAARTPCRIPPYKQGVRRFKSYCAHQVKWIFRNTALGAKSERRAKALPPRLRKPLDLLAGRLSTRSLQITGLCLERAIRYAEVRDLARRNVTALVKAPAGRAGRPSKSPIPEQAQDLLRAAAGSPPVPLCRALDDDGCGPRNSGRSGEPRSTSTSALSRPTALTGPPPTPKSRRVLSCRAGGCPIAPRASCRQSGGRLLAGVLWHDHDLVFASAVGTPLDRHNVLREFRKITRAAGLGTDASLPRCDRGLGRRTETGRPNANARVFVAESLDGQRGEPG